MSALQSIRNFLLMDKESLIADEARGNAVVPVADGTVVPMGADAGDGYQHLSAMLTMDASLMQRYADYENMDDYPELCVTGDTLVRTLDGPVRIDSLAQRYAPGERFGVIAYDIVRREFVAAQAHSPRLTKRDTVCEVVFDTGDVLRCTLDHKILTRDGRWVKAAELRVGDSVMPLNSRVNASGYMRIMHPEKPANERWEYLYRVVARTKFGQYDTAEYSVHHKDENKLNDSWENIELLTPTEHYRLHQPSWTDTSANLKWTDERREKHAERLRGNAHRKGKTLTFEQKEALAAKWKFKQRSNIVELPVMLQAVRSSTSLAEAARKLGLNWSTLCRRLSRNGHDYRREIGKNGTNHKVVAVRVLGEQDVYDLTTDKYHNFVANGIVVHNSSALDYYADDTTIPDSIHGKTIWAVSRDHLFRDLIDDCLHRRMRIEEDIWPAVRTFCKYGNLFAENVVADKLGLVGLNWLPVPTVRRVVGKRGNLLGYVQDTACEFNFIYSDFERLLKERDKKDKDTTQGRDLEFFYPWEITHWRLRSKYMRSLYGYSILDPARWIWKRLQMLEDTALVYKLTRSPARYAFYIDTSDLPPKQAMALVEKVRRRFKKRKLIDPSTGKLDFRYNPLTPDEDFFIPVRKDKESTRIDVIAGPDYQNMDDIEYFRGKLMFSVKIPRSYWTSDAEPNKGQVAQEDVRFARTAMRIQREFRNGIKQSVRVHLAALNIDPDSTKWDIKMSVPSAIFELQQIEVLNAQAGLASSLENWFDKEWIIQHVFHATEDDAAYVMQQKAAERDREAKQAAATEQEIANIFPDAKPPEPPGEASAQEDIAVDERIQRLIESQEETRKTTKKVLKEVAKMKPTFFRMVANDRRR
jgi:hypothetical protein